MTDISILGQVKMVSERKIGYACFKSGNYRISVCINPFSKYNTVEIFSVDNGVENDYRTSDVYEAEGYIKQKMNIYGNGEGNYILMSYARR